MQSRRAHFYCFLVLLAGIGERLSVVALRRVRARRQRLAAASCAGADVLALAGFRSA
jgi:hypothetical protein